MERSERTCSHTTYHREPVCRGCVCTAWYQQHVTLQKAKLQAWKGQQVKRSGQRGLNRKGTENITVVGLLGAIPSWKVHVLANVSTCMARLALK